MAGREFAHTGRKVGAGGLPPLQSIASEQPAKAQLHIDRLDQQLLVHRQKRANILQKLRLAMHGTIPAHAQQLRDAVRVERGWDNCKQFLRDRCRRAVKRGRDPMNGGYLRFLR